MSVKVEAEETLNKLLELVYMMEEDCEITEDECSEVYKLMNAVEHILFKEKFQ